MWNSQYSKVISLWLVKWAYAWLKNEKKEMYIQCKPDMGVWLNMAMAMASGNHLKYFKPKNLQLFYLFNFYNAGLESTTWLEWFELGLVRLNLGKKNRKGELKREFFSLCLLGLGRQKQNMYGKENGRLCFFGVLCFPLESNELNSNWMNGGGNVRGK